MGGFFQGGWVGGLLGLGATHLSPSPPWVGGLLGLGGESGSEEFGSTEKFDSMHPLSLIKEMTSDRSYQ